MFNKTKPTMINEKPTGANGTTIINAGTTLTGDINSQADLRIDGTIIGNISSLSKIVIGANGKVEGNLHGNQADIVGTVTGNIFIKDLLQLRGECTINGDVAAGKLQVEPTATFNGKCQMGKLVDTNENGSSKTITTAKFVVEKGKNELQPAAK